MAQRALRMSNLLRTRVEIEQQQSSQALLATMNHPQDMPLKMQSTGEGLSVAAIVCQVVVSYLAKGGAEPGLAAVGRGHGRPGDPAGGGGVWWSLRRLHHRIFHKPPRR